MSEVYKSRAKFSVESPEPGTGLAWTPASELPIAGPLGHAPSLTSTLQSALLSAYLFSFLSQACDLGFYLLLFTFLPLSEVGRFSWVMAVMAFVSVVLDLGISPALTREFSQHKTPFWLVFRQAFWVRTPGGFLSLLLLAVWLVAGRPDTALGMAVFLAGLDQLVRSLAAVFTAWLRAMERQLIANMLTAISAAGRLGVGVGLIWMAGVTAVPSLFAALLVVELLGCAAAWMLSEHVRRQTTSVHPEPETAAGNDQAELRARLRATWLNFGAITLLTVLQNRLDWLMVSYFLSKEALGQYSMANKCYEVAMTLVGLAVASAFPWMCRVRGQHSAGLGVFLKGVLVGGGFLALAGALIGPEVLRLLWGQKYAAGEVAIRLLLLGAVVAIFDTLAYHLLLAKGSERFILVATIVATALQAALNVLLIPRWGIQGAVAGMLGLIMAVTVLYLYGAWTELRSFGWGLVLFPCLLAVAGSLILRASLDPLPRTVLGLCLWMAASAGLLYTHRRGLGQMTGLGVQAGR